VSGLRVQGDPVRELAVLSAGLCPDDRTRLVPLYRGARNCPRLCGTCGLAWETGKSADGTPGYGYGYGKGRVEWYHVRSLKQAAVHDGDTPAGQRKKRHPARSPKGNGTGWRSANAR